MGSKGRMTGHIYLVNVALDEYVDLLKEDEVKGLEAVWGSAQELENFMRILAEEYESGYVDFEPFIEVRGLLDRIIRGDLCRADAVAEIISECERLSDLLCEVCNEQVEWEWENYGRLFP